MPDYRWKGVDTEGKNVKGTTTANSEDELKEELLKQKIALLSCKEIYDKASFAKEAIPSIRISLQHQASFFHDLSIILDSGIPLLDALKLIKSYTASRKFKKIITRLIYKVSEGTSLSNAMEQEKNNFSPLMIQIIKSGEESGKLDVALRQLSVYLTKKLALQQQLKQAALMPVITLIFALCIIAGISIYIIPQFEPLFTSMQNKPLVLSLSNLFQSEYTRIVIVLFLVIAFIMLQGIRKIEYLSNVRDKISLHIPVIGKIIILTNFINFARTLSLLMESGRSIKSSIILASTVCTNSRIAKATKQAALNIDQGESLHQAFQSINTYYMPEFLLAAISLGEKTGKLEVMLKKCSLLLEKQLMSRITFLATIFQPILLVGIGIFIAFLLMSLYMPILDLGTTFA